MTVFPASDSVSGAFPQWSVEPLIHCCHWSTTAGTVRDLRNRGRTDPNCTVPVVFKFGLEISVTSQSLSNTSAFFNPFTNISFGCVTETVASPGAGFTAPPSGLAVHVTPHHYD